MKTIVVKTQAEWDALPKSFQNKTTIEIRTDGSFWLQISKVPENGSAVLYGSSRAELWDSSRAVLYGSSRAELYGSSRAVLYGSSRAVLRDSSRAELRGSSRAELRDSSRAELWVSSRAELYGSSSAELWGSSSAVLWGSSRAVLRDSSSAVLRGSSSAVLWESSSAEAFDFAMLSVFSSGVVIAKLMDYSVASLRNVKPKIEKKSETATVIKTPTRIERSFKEWLKEGYVNADGITKKLLSKKKLNDIEIFEVEEFLDRKSSYVVKRGETFSHGETVEKAIESLRYKLTDRDTTKYKGWKLTDKKTIEELIQAYRAITGACEFGVKQFCESVKLKDKMTVKDVFKITDGKYGHDKFKGFFEEIL